MKQICQELPIDVVEEILSRLPAEHVLRCKLLSKTYYHLITNPTFIKKHLLFHQHSRNTNMAVMIMIPDSKYHTLQIMRHHSTCEKPYYAPYKPPGRYPHGIQIVGSCNGLLCLQLSSKKHILSHTLWNPTTREIFKIRNPKLDRCVIRSSYGFGYDPRCGGDYKVVKIVDYDSAEGLPSPFACHIWSLSTNQWKEIGHVLPRRVCHQHLVDHTALLVRNNLYWLARPCKEPRDGGEGGEDIIFSFDMSTDSTFRVVTMPKDRPEGGFWPTLNNFMGSLALFAPLFSNENGDVPYCVWVMDGDSNNSSCSWTKKLTIVRPFSQVLLPTQVSINGNFVMERFVHWEYVEFQFYGSSGNKQVETESVPWCSTDMKPWCFTSSLVSINKHCLNQQSSTRKRNRQGQQLLVPKQRQNDMAPDRETAEEGLAVSVGPEDESVRRSGRIRRPPQRFDDYSRLRII